MSDNSDNHSHDSDAEAEAAIVEIVKSFFTSRDGHNFMRGNVSGHVANEIRGDTQFFDSLLRTVVADFFQTAPGQAIIRDVVQETLAVDTGAATSVAAPPSSKSTQATDASTTPSTKSTSKYLGRLCKRKNSKSPAPPSKTTISPALKTTDFSLDDDDEDLEDNVAKAVNSDSELECVHAASTPKKQPAKFIMQLPDRFQYWQPILDGLSDCQTYPAGEFATIRDEDNKDVIISKVKEHFTTVVAMWQQ